MFRRPLAIPGTWCHFVFCIGTFIGRSTKEKVQQQEFVIVSIGGVTTNPWNDPYPALASSGAAASDLFTVAVVSDSVVQPSAAGPSAGGTSVFPTQSITGTQPTPGGDLFQQLTSELQAVLLQNQIADAQPVGPGAAAGIATTPHGATASSAEQAAINAQAFLTQPQAGQSGGGVNFQQSATIQAPATGAVASGDEPQTHHRHHHSGGSSSGGGNPGEISVSSAASSGNVASASDRNGAQAFAADIARVQQAYAGQAAATPAATSLIA
jgi:hypothetical protein